MSFELNILCHGNFVLLKKKWLLFTDIESIAILDLNFDGQNQWKHNWLAIQIIPFNLSRGFGWLFCSKNDQWPAERFPVPTYNSYLGNSWSNYHSGIKLKHYSFRIISYGDWMLTTINMIKLWLVLNHAALPDKPAWLAIATWLHVPCLMCSLYPGSPEPLGIRLHC